MVTTNWQITATTFHCDAVDDEVTVLVHKDWTAKCTGYAKYVENLDSETAKTMKNKSRKLHRSLKCEGPMDFRVTEYRDKLMKEASK